MVWLRSALYFVCLVLSILLYGVAILGLHRFISQDTTDKLAHSWACLNVWLQKAVCGLRYEVQGKQYLDQLPAVVMCKHQSAWETIAIPCILPAQQSWVLKKELLKLPFFGRVLQLYRSIPIDRQAGRRAMLQVIKDGMQHLQDKRSVIIFPEGTRTLPGQKGKYNMGGAVLAAKSAVDVIPIAHNGGVFWDAGGFKKYPGTIQVRIGPPISTAGKSNEAITAEVEAWIEGEMQALPTRRP